MDKKKIAEFMAIADSYWQETDVDKLPVMGLKKHATADLHFGKLGVVASFIESAVRICPGVPVNTVCTMLRVLGVEVTDDGGV